jgi:hypothetical protein
MHGDDFAIIKPKFRHEIEVQFEEMDGVSSSVPDTAGATGGT